MSKTGRKNKKYSPEFKIRVIMDIRKHHLGYRETARKYLGAQSRSEEESCKGSIKRWERIFLEEGAEVERIHTLVQQRKNFLKTKRNEPSSIPSSFANNLIFNFCLNFWVHFKNPFILALVFLSVDIFTFVKYVHER